MRERHLRLAAWGLLGAILCCCIGKDFSVAESAADLRRLDRDVPGVRIRGLPDEDVSVLERFDHLKTLDFESGWGAMPLRLTSAGFEQIADLGLPVRAVGLAHCKGLDDAGLRQVARLRRLETVVLKYSTGFTLAALRPVLVLPDLEYLDLRGCSQIDDSWVGALGTCRTLTQLGVARTGLSEEGVARLRAALPECHVDNEAAYIEAVLDRAQRPGWGGPPERKGK